MTSFPDPFVPQRRRACRRCGRPGPFRSTRVQVCIQCQAGEDEFLYLYRRMYRRARDRAVAVLVLSHRTEFESLMCMALNEERETAMRAGHPTTMREVRESEAWLDTGT